MAITHNARGSHPLLAALIGAAVVVALALTWMDPDSTSTAPAPARPGSAAVYTQIAAMNDCKALQETFTRNMNDRDRRQRGDPLREAVTAYAFAADDRMQAIGCY